VAGTKDTKPTAASSIQHKLKKLRKRNIKFDNRDLKTYVK